MARFVAASFFILPGSAPHRSMQPHIKHRRRASLAATLALAAFGSLGCGGEGPALVPVKGKVLLNGQPLTTGNVTTMPPSGRGAFGPIQSDGTFELTSGREAGALVGLHKVAVVAVEGEAFQGAEAPATGPAKSLVPQRYNNPETSKLTIEVKADGENAPVLELTTP